MDGMIEACIFKLQIAILRTIHRYICTHTILDRFRQIHATSYSWEVGKIILGIGDKGNVSFLSCFTLIKNKG